MSLKDRISSPLEAGQSVLDGHNLPTQVTAALEYASRRLARKATHLTLVVVRRDYQIPSATLPPSASADLPASPPSATSSDPASASAASTPARQGFSFARIKSLVRSNSSPTPNTTRRGRTIPKALDLQRSGMASPAFSTSSMSSASTADSTFSAGPRLFRSPLSPSTPSAPSMPMTPATPFTVVSSTATTTTTTEASSAASGIPGPQASSSFGIKLVHVSPLSSKEEKALSQSIRRAARRFHVGPDWLPDAAPPSAYGLNADLIHRSLSQNEVLFSSEGLTLLSLDHLYTFKASLAAYVRARSPRRLEDAVDELRRLVLSRARRTLRRSALARAYAGLGPPADAALADVMRMYQRAYGGAAGETGVLVDDDNDDDIDVRARARARTDKPLPPLPETGPAEEDEDDGGEEEVEEVEEEVEEEEVEEYYRARARELREAATLEELRRTTPRISPPPPPRIPALKLQTSFDGRRLRPVPARAAQPQQQKQQQQQHQQGCEEDEEELTARPGSGHAAAGWAGMTMLGNADAMGSRTGPATPHAYDDISPVTRGEWGFLMFGSGGKGRMAAIEMC